MDAPASPSEQRLAVEFRPFSQQNGTGPPAAIVASPLPIGVASIASGFATTLNVQVPASLTRQLGRTPSSARSARSIESHVWTSGSSESQEAGSPHASSGARLDDGLTSMFAAAAEGNVMSVYTVGLHGDPSTVYVNPVSLNSAAVPSHLQNVPFAAGTTGVDALRRGNVGHRPSLVDIESNIQTGKWSRASSAASTPKRRPPQLRTDLSIAASPGMEDMTPVGMVKPLSLRSPLHSSTYGGRSRAQSSVTPKDLLPRGATTPVKTFTFSTFHVGTPPPPEESSPKVETPQRRVIGARIDTMAIWARARAAFLKYAASRASEVEDLFKKQQAQVEAAVKAGLVIVEDDGTTVPITRQGDLAHYTIQALRHRRRMRRHHGVKAAIERHWGLLTSMKPEDARVVTKDEYIAFFLVAYGVLMPDEDIEQSAKMLAIESDWDSDRKGEEYLDHAKFFSSLFELVDNWCETISATDYIRLLDELYNSMLSSMIIGNEVMNAVEARGLGSLALVVEEDSVEDDDDEHGSSTEAAIADKLRAASDGPGGSDTNPSRGVGGSTIDNQEVTSDAMMSGSASALTKKSSSHNLRSDSSAKTRDTSAYTKAAAASVINKKARPHSGVGDGGNGSDGPYLPTYRTEEKKEVHAVWKSGWSKSNDVVFSGGLDPAAVVANHQFRSYTIPKKASTASSTPSDTEAPAMHRAARKRGSATAATVHSGNVSADCSESETESITSDNRVRVASDGIAHRRKRRSHASSSGKQSSRSSGPDDTAPGLPRVSFREGGPSGKTSHRSSDSCSDSEYVDTTGLSAADASYLLSLKSTVLPRVYNHGGRLVLPGVHKVNVTDMFGTMPATEASRSPVAASRAPASTSDRLANLIVDTSVADAAPGFAIRTLSVSPRPRTSPTNASVSQSRFHSQGPPALAARAAHAESSRPTGWLAITSPLSVIDVKLQHVPPAPQPVHKLQPQLPSRAMSGIISPISSPSGTAFERTVDRQVIPELTLTPAASASSALPPPVDLDMRQLRQQVTRARDTRSSAIQQLQQRATRPSAMLARQSVARLDALQQMPVSMAALREATRAELARHEESMSSSPVRADRPISFPPKAHSYAVLPRASIAGSPTRLPAVDMSPPGRLLHKSQSTRALSRSHVSNDV